MSEMFNLLPRTTAMDNGQLPLIYGKVTNRRQRALAQVGLAHRIHADHTQPATRALALWES